MDEMIFNREIAFGLLPFETIYFDQNGPKFVYEHYKRLMKAHRILGLLFSIKYEEFCREIERFISTAIDDVQGVVKVVFFNGGLHMNFRKFSYTKEHYDRGFRLQVSKSVRDSRNILNYVKTFNYGQNYIEDIRSRKMGFDTALFLNQKGHICETSYANIFFAREGKVYTPRVSCGILRGIMRDKVIDALRVKGCEVIKTCIKSADMCTFEECFITNSVMGIMPVSEIDDVKYREGEFRYLLSQTIHI